MTMLTWIRHQINKKAVTRNALTITCILGETIREDGWGDEKPKQGKLPPNRPRIWRHYEDDAITLEVYRFAEFPSVRIQSNENGFWQDVYETEFATGLRFNDGAWVDYIAEFADELRSKDRQAEKAKRKPLDRGGFFEPSNHVCVDESPHQEIVLPRGELAKKHGDVPASWAGKS